MASGRQDPAEALESIDSSSPAEARARTLEILADAVDADAGMLCRYCLSDGAGYHTMLTVVGEHSFAEKLRSLDTAEQSLSPPPDPCYPPNALVQSFLTESDRPYSSVSEPGTFRELCDAEGVNSRAGALIYDDAHCVGWVVLFRVKSSAFGDHEVARLNGLVSPTVGALSHAERIEAKLLGGQPARMLVDPETFDVECATRNATEWLEDGRFERFSEALRERRDSRSFPCALNVDGFNIWLAEMSGELGERIIATVERAPRPRRSPDSVLTPRQREVVGYAAAGATNREIAETLGITPDTVSDHLSAAYERLGVANRVELALKIET